MITREGTLMLRGDGTLIVTSECNVMFRGGSSLMITRGRVL